MKLRWSHFLLETLAVGAIMLSAFFLRTWSLGTLPAALNRDEAALAYNAKLLAETGRDEWGVHWPVALRSFGDYKLIGYPAVLTLFFRIFGETNQAVRLPSAVAGTALLVFIWLFLRDVGAWSSSWRLGAVAVVAVTPVLIFFSRMAFEANLALTYFFAALWLAFCLQPPRTWQRLLQLGCLAAAVFAGALTYNTPLLVLPFLVPVIVWWHGWREWRTWLPVVITIVIFGGAAAFNLLMLAQQKSAITIFSDPSTWSRFVLYRESLSGWQQKTFANKYVYYSGIIVANLGRSFLPDFLVLEGGQHPWHALPGFGHVTMSTYILSMLGLGTVALQALRRRQALKRNFVYLLIFLTLLGFLPASVTVDAPHATRSIVSFVLFTLLAVWTMKEAWCWARTRGAQTRLVAVALLVFIVISVALETTRYLAAYISKYPVQSGEILQANLNQSLSAATARVGNAPTAVVDPDGYIYIRVAWEKQLSPSEFFQTILRHQPDRIGFQYGYRVAEYRFIAHEQDRFPEERAMITWQPVSKSWEVTYY